MRVDGPLDQSHTVLVGSSLTLRHAPPQLVEEVEQEHHFVLGLGRFRSLHRRRLVEPSVLSAGGHDVEILAFPQRCPVRCAVVLPH